MQIQGRRNATRTRNALTLKIKAFIFKTDNFDMNYGTPCTRRSGDPVQISMELSTFFANVS